MDVWIVEHRVLYVGNNIEEFNIDIKVFLKKGEAIEYAWKLAQNKIKNVEYTEDGNYVGNSSSGRTKWPDDRITTTHKFFDFKTSFALEYNTKA